MSFTSFGAILLLIAAGCLLLIFSDVLLKGDK